jgi:hypothetical protein
MLDTVLFKLRHHGDRLYYTLVTDKALLTIKAARGGEWFDSLGEVKAALYAHFTLRRGTLTEPDVFCAVGTQRPKLRLYYDSRLRAFVLDVMTEEKAPDTAGTAGR